MESTMSLQRGKVHPVTVKQRRQETILFYYTTNLVEIRLQKKAYALYVQDNFLVKYYITTKLLNHLKIQQSNEVIFEQTGSEEC